MTVGETLGMLGDLPLETPVLVYNGEDRIIDYIDVCLTMVRKVRIAATKVGPGYVDHFREGIGKGPTIAVIVLGGDEIADEDV